ncbi:MAG: PHP domain-containing protein [Candidatus Sumerlaeia bacterium]|nr:PHP domain-containing protein [Candidatus Sumerlaeia bacterium]
MTLPRFAHLGARSEFSLGESLSPVEELCRAAARDGQESLGLADLCSLAAAPAFHRAALRNGLRPVLGLELNTLPHGSERFHDTLFRVRMLADSALGWKRLLRLANAARTAERRGPAARPAPPHVPLSAVRDDARGLHLLVGGEHGELTDALLKDNLERAEEHLDFLLQSWPAERVLVALPAPCGDDGLRRARLLAAAAKHFGLRAVAVPEVHGAHAADDALWHLLRRNRAQPGSPARLALTAEAGGLLREEGAREHLLERAAVAALYADFPDALAASADVAAACSGFAPPQAERRFPVHDFTRGIDAESYLWNAAFERATARHGTLPREVKERLNSEFRMILDAGLANALVTLVRLHEEFESRGIRCGPGAGVFSGSLIASLLGATRFDPVEFGVPMRFPENIATQFPPLEVYVPCSEEEAARETLGGLFGGQLAAVGKWQRARAGQAQEALAAVLRLGGKERAEVFAPGRLDAARAAEAERPATQLPAREWQLRSPEFLAWALRRLEGRPRELAAVPGKFTFSVEPLGTTLPLRQDRDGARACEWSEEELVELRFGTAFLRTHAVLDLVGEAVALSRVHAGDPSLRPKAGAAPPELAFDLLGDGATTGIQPLEAPSVRRALKARKPRTLREYTAALAEAAPRTFGGDLPLALLCYSAAEMKATHPQAFYAAALSHAGADTRRLAALLDELEARRIPLQPLDLNCSDWHWAPEAKAVRPGLCVIRDLPRAAADELLRLRRELAFDDLADLLRTDPARVKDAHLLTLLRAGALDGFGPGRAQLRAQFERLSPLLRPRRRDRSADEGVLSFFSDDPAWWLEPEAPADPDAPPPPAGDERREEREANSGVELRPRPRDPEAERFLERARALRPSELKPRLAGKRVTLQGRVDAIEPLTGADPGAVQVWLAGVAVRLRGSMARRASSGSFVGRECLVVGSAQSDIGGWHLDAESFGSVDAFRVRAERARTLYLDTSPLDAEQLSELLGLLGAFGGETPVRLLTRPLEPPRALRRIEQQRVLLCPQLEVSLNELLGRERWRLDEPANSDGEAPREVSGRAATLVKRLFAHFG